MFYFISLAAILFILSCLLIAYFVHKNFSGCEKIYQPSFEKKFSILIAAKNEELKIPDLNKSLVKLNYPADKTEIIIADDNSADNTYYSALKTAEPFPHIKVLKAAEKKLPGKKGVLNYALSKTSNEYILITDADCIPERDWVNKYSAKFSEGYNFLFGIAPFIPDGNIINKISCFENMRGSLITFAAAGMGIPYSASARNFGFRKSSFISLNGYFNTRQTLSGDDDLLLREALKNKLKIGTVPFEGSKVFSYTKKNLKDYMRQKSRHTKTSFYYLPLHQILLSFWHLSNIFFLLSPLISIVNPIFFLLFLIKIFSDLFLVLMFQKKFGYGFRPLQIIYLQFFYELFLILNLFGALFKKDKWN
jgi:cellulose synthase/poly-beta-1,6-N-acetylglucosamine synthase-like glycosyltransferase